MMDKEERRRYLESHGWTFHSRHLMGEQIIVEYWTKDHVVYAWHPGDRLPFEAPSAKADVTLRPVTDRTPKIMNTYCHAIMIRGLNGWPLEITN